MAKVHKYNPDTKENLLGEVDPEDVSADFFDTVNAEIATKYPRRFTVNTSPTTMELGKGIVIFSQAMANGYAPFAWMAGFYIRVSGLGGAGNSASLKGSIVPGLRDVFSSSWYLSIEHQGVWAQTWQLKVYRAAANVFSLVLEPTGAYSEAVSVEFNLSGVADSVSFVGDVITIASDARTNAPVATMTSVNSLALKVDITKTTSSNAALTAYNHTNSNAGTSAQSLASLTNNIGASITKFANSSTCSTFFGSGSTLVNYVGHRASSAAAGFAIILGNTTTQDFIVAHGGIVRGKMHKLTGNWVFGDNVTTETDTGERVKVIGEITATDDITTATDLIAGGKVLAPHLDTDLVSNAASGAGTDMYVTARGYLIQSGGTGYWIKMVQDVEFETLAGTGDKLAYLDASGILRRGTSAVPSAPVESTYTAAVIPGTATGTYGVQFGAYEENAGLVTGRFYIEFACTGTGDILGFALPMAVKSARYPSTAGAYVPAGDVYEPSAYPSGESLVLRSDSGTSIVMRNGAAFLNSGNTYYFTGEFHYRK